MEGATTCNLKFGERYVLKKKTKVKFGATIHHSRDLLDCISVHFIVGKQIGMAKEMNSALLEKVRYLLSNASLDKSFWAETIEC